jgi:uncharacterized Zn finger protein
MGLINLASANSLWRGMDYFEQKKVLLWSKTGQGTFDGKVQGNSIYQVHLDEDHPRRSTCTCPFADGRRVICKHMVAMYFTIYPDVAKEVLEEAENWEKEEAEREQQHYAEIERYVKSLSKAQLQEELLRYIVESEQNRHYW